MGSDFSQTKYNEYNKILIKLCTNYYVQYWKDRNIELYNSKMQRKRLILQYENKRQEALIGLYSQVKSFIIKRELNLDQCTNEYTRT